MHGFHFWCFNDEWGFSKEGIVEDIREGWRADIALTDVFVSIDSALIGRISRR